LCAVRLSKLQIPLVIPAQRHDWRFEEVAEAADAILKIKDK
jgi:hypothetical protein